MKLSSREDIQAPIDEVYAQIIDANSIERGLLRRGVEVRRDGTHDQLSAGDEWAASFTFRGRQRNVTAVIRDLRDNERLAAVLTSGGIEVVSVLDLIALSKDRTRMELSTNIKPKSLSARVLVQSLKLTRGSVERKFNRRFADAAATLEARTGL